MCNNHEQQKESGQGCHDWQGLYPDLSGLFNQGNQLNNNNSGRSSLFSMLLGLLGIDSSPYLSPTQSHPSSSAPPPSPGPSTGSTNNYFTQGQQRDNCHCNGHHEPDILPLLIARAQKFSRIFTRGLIMLMSIIMFVSTISLLPNTLLYNAAFFLLAGGLGLHLPTLVAGHVLYALLCSFDPLFLALVSIWAVHKTVVSRKPLININHWKRRLARIHSN